MSSQRTKFIQGRSGPISLCGQECLNQLGFRQLARKPTIRMTVVFAVGAQLQKWPCEDFFLKCTYFKHYPATATQKLGRKRPHALRYH